MRGLRSTFKSEFLRIGYGCSVHNRSTHPVVDWNGVEEMMQYITNDYLMVDPSEHPVLLVDPPISFREQRSKWVA